MADDSNASSPPKEAVEQALSGHIGHLTQVQQEALEAFKSRLSSASLYRAIGPDNPTPSHEDSTLLRFLRARKWSLPQAEKQFSDHAAWREKYHVDDLYKNANADEMEETRKLYPSWCGRRDKLGRPLSIFALRLFNDPNRMKQLNSSTLEQRYLQIIVLYEYTQHFLMKLCSTLPSLTYPTPITGNTTIVDLKGASLTTLWTLRAHLQQASVLANANYPETLACIFIVNAPSFFPTIWGWLKVWFDEGTRNKIHILSKADEKDLLKWIDSKDLMREYGGELDWTYGDPISLDDAAKAQLQNIGGVHPRGPWFFENGEAKSG